MLTNGDNGVIRTLDIPIYIVAIWGPKLFCLDRTASPFEVSIDPAEYRFKVAVSNKNVEEMMSMIKDSHLIGQSIIAYMQKKGYPEMALKFVKDKKTRFGLALECGELEVNQ